MKNWLNQDIEVGSIVYRGARNGNTSSFKVGRVIKVNDDKDSARVEWLLEPYFWRDKPGAGTCDINSLVLIDLTLREIRGMIEDQWGKQWESARRGGNVQRQNYLQNIDYWWRKL